MEESAAVYVDQFLPHPPAKVWRALTEPALVAQWLMPGDFRLEVGHRYRMRADPIPAAGFSGAIEAEVLGFEPGRLLRVGWRDAAGDQAAAWTITWTLEPEGTGTRLFLAHEGFDPASPAQQQARRITGGGWRSRVLLRLRAVLDQPDLPSQPDPLPVRRSPSP
jgi:uncharacterized protein YndB with AHSA1/START domain